jgi:hypothetical protein
VWGLIFIDIKFRELIFGLCFIRELDISNVGELKLSMLAEMSGNRIAWILFEIKNIFLVIRNDHDLILIIVFVFNK